MPDALAPSAAASPPLRLPTRSTALMFALGYAALGALWVLGTGWTFHPHPDDRGAGGLPGAINDLLFVVVTAVLLWFVLDRYFQALRHSVRQLQAREQRYRELVQESNSAILRWKCDGTIAFINDYAQRLFGYREDEVVGRPVDILLPERESVGTDLRTLVRNIVANPGQHASVVNENLCRDGRRVWMAWTNKPIFDAHGEVAEILAVGSDITARKQAERVLTERLELQDQIAKIVETVPGLICSFRLQPDGTVSMPYASPMIEDIYGVRAEDVRQDFTPVASLFHPDDQGHVQQTIGESARTLAPWHDTYRVRHPTKGERWLEGHSKPRREPDGSILWHGFIQDITESKRAQQIIVESEQRYRTLFENMNAGFVLFEAILDESGTAVDLIVLAANEGFATTTGLKPRDAVGRRLTQLLAGIEKDAVDWIRTYGRVALTGESLQFEQGSELLGSHFSIAAFRAGPNQCAVTFVDISQRKAAEAALQQRNEELVRFTYTVSHDLKSPLVTIQTFLGFLEQDLRTGDSGRIATDLNFIRKAAEKMLQMLEELLELSRVGRKSNPPEYVTLQVLAGEAQELVAGAIAARGVQVRVSELPVVLHGDRQRLLEVFQNLLDNAVKFMGGQPAPQVEIGAEETARGIELFVRDNGMGVDPRHQAKLFGLFEKLHPGTPGTGIGLALVKRIVEVHGGRIWAESAGPGQGTTFRFILSGTRRS